MKITKSQILEINTLVQEYNEFNKSLLVIQEEIEKLDLKRTQLLVELESFHSREEAVYLQISNDNNISVENVKSGIINSIIA